MGLTDELRTAVESPPPPRFDLDDLIQRGRSRRTRSRVLLGVAGFVAVAMVTVGVYAATGALRPAGRPAHQAAAPAAAPSSPTEITPSNTFTQSATDATAQRLTAALAGLPKSLHIPSDVQFNYHAGAGGGTLPYYNVHWQVNGVMAYIDIFDEPMPDPHENACGPGSRGDPTYGCTHTIDVNGTTYVVSNARTATTQRSTTVDAFRPDHTHVTITATGIGHAQIPSEDALTSAAHDPGLSLHP